MATINEFEQLPIWQEARKLYRMILIFTERPDVKSNFRFKSQIIEASGSVMDNIAAGFERDSRLEFINFLSIAKGSAGETRSQLYRGFDMGYWNESQLLELSTQYKILGANIANFIRYLNQSGIKGQKFKDRT